MKKLRLLGLLGLMMICSCQNPFENKVTCEKFDAVLDNYTCDYFIPATFKTDYYKDEVSIFIDTSLNNSYKPIKIFEVNDLTMKQLKELPDSYGDLESPPVISIIKINNKYEFQTSSKSSLSGSFYTSCDLEKFKKLYDAKVVFPIEKNKPFELTVNLDKAPIEKIKYLLKEYNKIASDDIKSISFSSLQSLKLITIILDFYVNYPNSAKRLQFFGGGKIYPMPYEDTTSMNKGALK